MRYDLERCFDDQDATFVVPLLSFTLSFLGGPESVSESGVRRFEVDVIQSPGDKVAAEHLDIGWSLAACRRRCPNLDDELAALRTGRTPLVEKRTEMAAYGIATCAICVYLPGRRIVRYNQGRPPDIVLSESGDCGVEVAGRATGGRAALRRVAEPNPSSPRRSEQMGKREWLRTRPGLREGYLSLWVFDDAVGMNERVK